MADSRLEALLIPIAAMCFALAFLTALRTRRTWVELIVSSLVGPALLVAGVLLALIAWRSH